MAAATAPVNVADAGTGVASSTTTITPGDASSPPVDEPTAPREMVTEVVIDVRERDLVDRMRGRHGVRVATMELGDLIFVYRGATVLIVERKTLADLAASIKDGRYHEQKLRLARADGADASRTLYLLEGVRDAPPHDVLMGVIVNTMLRDNMKVYRTASLDETVDLVERMRARLFAADAPAYFADAAAPTSGVVAYAGTIRRVKKDNLSAKTCTVSALAQVPGVSPHMAAAIVDHHGGAMARVCDALRADGGERATAQLTWTTPSGRSRRVGPAVARRLRAYLVDGVGDNTVAGGESSTPPRAVPKRKRKTAAAVVEPPPTAPRACSV